MSDEHHQHHQNFEQESQMDGQSQTTSEQRRHFTFYPQGHQQTENTMFLRDTNGMILFYLKVTLFPG